MEISLRPYQSKAITDIRQSYAKAKRTLFVLPTGGGKTYTFTAMAKMALDKGKTVFFLVHKKGLVKQISKSLRDFDIRHGIIGGKFPKQYYLPAQVCSVQSLINRLGDPNLPTPDLIIIDEAHHATAGTWRKIIDYYNDTYCLGVTATPIRTDGKGLGDVFNSMVLGPSIMELISMGNLVMPTYYMPKSTLDLSAVRLRSDGEFNEDDLLKLIDKPKITGDAVAKYRELCDKVPAVYFCINVKHCEHVAAEFRAAGYVAEPVHGEMDERDIEEILQGLGKGTVHVVTSCNLISEGTDIPAIGCVGHLRPTMSLALYLQMNGRGLRPCEGKDNCIIIDHVDNYTRHGHPCEDREWSLEGKKKGKKKDKDNVKTESLAYDVCTGCFAVFERADACPHCGTVVIRPVREIEKVEGELVKVEFEKKQERKAVGMSKTLDQLWNIKVKKGYKDYWVKYKFESKVLKAFDDGKTLQEINKLFKIAAIAHNEQAYKQAAEVAFRQFYRLKK